MSFAATVGDEEIHRRRTKTRDFLRRMPHVPQTILSLSTVRSLQKFNMMGQSSGYAAFAVTDLMAWMSSRAAPFVGMVDVKGVRVEP
jgi:hypothetical protein